MEWDLKRRREKNLGSKKGLVRKCSLLGDMAIKAALGPRSQRDWAERLAFLAKTSATSTLHSKCLNVCWLITSASIGRPASPWSKPSAGSHYQSQADFRDLDPRSPNRPGSERVTALIAHRIAVPG